MDDTGKTTPSEGGRKPLIAGLAALLLLGAAIAGWLRFHPGDAVSPPPQQAAENLEESGFVKLEEAAKAHSGYEKLLGLRNDCARLSETLSLQQRKLLLLTSPNILRKPFEDAVDQKKKQTLIKEHGEFMEKLAEAEKAKREETRPLYEKARDEINAAYFNEIFNTQLKLDNADVMRLSEETVADLKRHLENLQRERGRHQFDLYQKYEAGIRAYTEQLAAEHGISLAELERETDARLRAEEMRIRSEAQIRNLDAVQRNMLDAVELRMKVGETKTAIRAKEAEIEALESAMTLELASQAAKLAVRHHLSIVYAAPMAAPLPGADAAEDVSRSLRVVGGTALDLTEELVRELKAGKQENPTNQSKKD